MITQLTAEKMFALLPWVGISLLLQVMSPAPTPLPDSFTAWLIQMMIENKYFFQGLGWSIAGGMAGTVIHIQQSKEKVTFGRAVGYCFVSIVVGSLAGRLYALGLPPGSDLLNVAIGLTSIVGYGLGLMWHRNPKRITKDIQDLHTTQQTENDDTANG